MTVEVETNVRGVFDGLARVTVSVTIEGRLLWSLTAQGPPDAVLARQLALSGALSTLTAPELRAFVSLSAQGTSDVVMLATAISLAGWGS